MAFLGHFLSSPSVHHVFKQKQFFVKMINGCTLIIFICRKCLMMIRPYSRIMYLMAGKSAISKTTRYADGAKRIQSVGILHHFAFQGLYLIFYTRSFKRNV